MGLAGFAAFGEVEEDALVGQGGFTDDGEVWREGGAEGGLGEVGVGWGAAAQQLLEHRVLGGNPFEDEMPGGKGAREGRDVVEGDLAAQRKVMRDGGHHYGVEVAFAAAEEGGV